MVALADRRALRHAVAQAGVETHALELHLDGDPEPWTLTLRSLPRRAPRTLAASLTRRGAPPPPPPPQRYGTERFVLRFPYPAVAVRRDGRVAYANGRARALLGRDAVRTGSVFAEGLPTDLRSLARRLVTVPAPLAPTRVELEDGLVLRVSGLAPTVDEPAVLFLEDATEEQRHDRVMREFLRNAAHQLRTPLAGIMAAVETLQSGAKDRPADRDRFLEHIETHARRLARVARGLLVLARTQLGEQPRIDFVELRPLLEELAGEVAPRDGVSILVDCEPGLAALAVPDLLQEALAALVDNAVSHTFEGEIRVFARERHGSVEIGVADAGAGILPEFRDRIFEPFYRIADDGAGFGLGLAIAAQAVAAMDGEIDVSDGAELGTVFTMTLRSARVVA